MIPTTHHQEAAMPYPQTWPQRNPHASRDHARRSIGPWEGGGRPVSGSRAMPRLHTPALSVPDLYGASSDGQALSLHLASGAVVVLDVIFAPALQWDGPLHRRSVSAARAEGSTAEVDDGLFGPEVTILVPGSGQVRIIGVDGEGWLLRAMTFAETLTVADVAAAEELLAEAEVHRPFAPAPNTVGDVSL